jgi:hypothetical protein
MDATDERFEEIVRQVRTDPSAAKRLARSFPNRSLPRPRAGPMPDGWYMIRVELLSGGGEHLVAPPGRDLLVSPNHTFRQLAELINASFARWDLGHLSVFRMPDGSEIGIPDEEDEVRDAARCKIGRREVGEAFVFEFDFGDSWLHRCAILETGVDPVDEDGAKPKGPVAVWGWGSIPDQYGRTTPEA